MASEETSKEEGGSGLGVVIGMLLSDRHSATRGKVLARSRSGSESGTRTGDPCDPSLAFYL